jgi:hypothetical protein
LQQQQLELHRSISLGDFDLDYGPEKFQSQKLKLKCFLREVSYPAGILDHHFHRPHRTPAEPAESRLFV